jgi:hypothetical protein
MKPQPIFHATSSRPEQPGHPLLPLTCAAEDLPVKSKTGEPPQALSRLTGYLLLQNTNPKQTNRQLQVGL